MEIEKNKKIMKLKDSYEDVNYFVEFYKEGDHIHFKLKESDLYPIYTFESDYTMDDFIQQHKAFKSCDDLDEVLQHLYNLYDSKKIDLFSAGTKEEKYLSFKLWDISTEDESKLFKMTLVMTENKDEDLAILYDIQKKQIANLKKIKSLVEDKSNKAKNNQLCEEILNLLKECQVDLNQKITDKK